MKFLFRLPVGPHDKARYFTDRAGHLLAPHELKETEFRLDTGAEVTFISRELADELSLDEQPISGFELADGRNVRVTAAKIRLNIGDRWMWIALSPSTGVLKICWA